MDTATSGKPAGENRRGPAQEPDAFARVLDRHTDLSDLVESERSLVASLRENAARLKPLEDAFGHLTGKKQSLEAIEKKLKELSGETLAEMVKADELELLYLHLQSMRNFMTVKDRLIQTQGGGRADDGSDAALPTEGDEARPKASS